MRRPAEVEQTVQLVPVCVAPGRAHFIGRDDEREVLAEACGLDLNEVWRAVGIERLDVVAETVAASVRDPLNPSGEVGPALPVVQPAGFEFIRPLLSQAS